VAEKKKMKLWAKILIGLVAGLVTGVILGPTAGYIKPVGTLFINAIKMLIVPQIFSSLVVGVISMKDPKKMGRIGLKTLALYLGTTAVAVMIGLTLGTFLQPGAGLNFEAVEQAAPQEAPSVVDTLVNLVPSNPVGSFASGSVLQIIVFSIFLGLAINLAGEKATPVASLFEAFAEVMYKLTAIIMEMAPYGVFALMAWVAGEYGLSVLLPLLRVILGVYAGCLIHSLLTYGGAIALLGRLNPIQFFKGILDAQAVAFTTTSSSGTLPATLRCAQKNLGVSRSVSSFVLPLGATINMDGTALYQGISALFVAQAYGVDLTFANYVTIILTSTLASIGTAGVPGAGLIMLSLVLSSVGLPLEGVAIVAGIDRILDMARTTLNVTGDAMVSLLIAKSENELDLSVYQANPEV
jgi:Na+/H+-dicarboxylate symporter